MIDKELNRSFHDDALVRAMGGKWEELIGKYPYMFRLLTGDVSVPAEPFALFGFECGIGWFDIVSDLCEKIDKILEPEDKETFAVVQIKEKYGTLRFYATWGNDEIGKAIEEAEKKSGETCELCGKPGKMMERKGWLQVRCKGCFHDRKRET